MVITQLGGTKLMSLEPTVYFRLESGIPENRERLTSVRLHTIECIVFEDLKHILGSI